MLIGLTGFARSGKDTAADFYCANFDFVKYSFAQPIKEAVKVMFSLNEDHVNGHLKEVVLPDLEVSPRFLMQTLGTEWGRETVNTNVWLLAAQRKLAEKANLSGGGFVIADIRFENEASFIRKNGGVLLHINRNDREKVLSHASEQGVSFMPGDININNNGALDDLYLQLTKVISALQDVA